MADVKQFVVEGQSIDVRDSVLKEMEGVGHNSIYRGKALGSAVTAAQWAAIEAGTFDDMYIGDFWTISGVNYRIAAFDYWLHTGDTECTDHHALIVPDTNLYTAQMNTSNDTTGGYPGSAMRTTNLTAAKTTIENAFGAAHILTHREYMENAVTNGKPAGGAWFDSDIDLMNERMVYGGPVLTVANDGSTIPVIYTTSKSQLALFRLDPSRITNRANWWLRDPVSAAYFAYVGYGGYAYGHGASYSLGVRPVFAICA